jgi:hypothetical protein
LCYTKKAINNNTKGRKQYAISRKKEYGPVRSLVALLFRRTLKESVSNISQQKQLYEGKKREKAISFFEFFSQLNFVSFLQKNA